MLLSTAEQELLQVYDTAGNSLPCYSTRRSITPGGDAVMLPRVQQPGAAQLALDAGLDGGVGRHVEPGSGGA